MTNLDSILKSGDNTLSTKVHLVKATVFPVVMYGCEIWTIKKAESRSIDAFELWCWRRLLRVPWTARRSNQSILKVSPGCSLDWCWSRNSNFGHLMQRADSFEKILVLGKIEGRRRSEWQRMRWLGDITDSLDIGLGGLSELVMDREDWPAAVHGVTKNRTWLSDWTELNKKTHYKEIKLQTNMSFEHTFKNHQQILGSWIQQYKKRIIPHNQVGLIPGLHLASSFKYQRNPPQ